MTDMKMRKKNMTRNEAIKFIEDRCESCLAYDYDHSCISTSDCFEAKRMAIEALSIVRCKDCKRYESDGGALMTCTLTDMIVDDECYCWWAERREP